MAAPVFPNPVTILTEKGNSFLDINILPFVNVNGKVVKLQSFDLVIDKKTQTQKISAATKHTFVSKSVLSEGRFVKIRIKESGIYKLTYEDLISMGIDPANVRVFGYGGGILEQSFLLPHNDDLPEINIWMEKGGDGVFNSGDYILFYAQGINKWAYDKTNSIFTHTPNSYSKYGYYFVSSNAGIGKKIEPKPIVIEGSPTIKTVEEFTDYKVYEKDLRSLVESGKEFYGETFSDVLSLNIPFNFPNPILTSPATVKLDVIATSTLTSTFTLSLNGTQPKPLLVPKKTDDLYEFAKAASAIYKYTPDAEAFNFNLTYAKSVPTSVGYLNYLEVNARRQLKMSGSVMQFQNTDYLTLDYYSQYQLSDANSNVQIWDVTDPININKVITENISGKVTFTAPSTELKAYIAIDPTASFAFPKPEVVGEIANQNLHGISQADLVIITHPDFVTQAETLAKAHREKDNLTTAVVTTEQVYNEFSSGTPDATSYRWIMKMLYEKALAANNPADLPKYLLLFGRGSFDNRNILSNSGDNFVLTYQAENSLVATLSYVTDDYFTFLDDNEGTQVPANLMDIGVGRFPVTTADQATDVVNKTIAYIDNKTKGYWKNQICFLADDGDGALHMKQSDSIAVSVARNFPSYQVNKIFLDAYLQEVSASGETYPLAKSKFQNLLRSGLFLLNFTGHASPAGWTNESILSVTDVKALSNKQLPLWVGATCDFLQFDIKSVSAGEHVILNPNGGGIGILSAARPVYASQNLTIDKLFCENLFKKQTNGIEKRVGDVLAYAKNNVGTEINKLSYIYMGDPAVKLSYPSKYKVVTTKINESTILGKDTLRALSVASISGFIGEQNGIDTVKNFNGELHAVVFDKIQTITTLNNHGDGSLTYKDRPNTLFSGSVEVKNGLFNFKFMLPRDIKYNFGTGRINYYANDNVNDYEAQSSFENFVVGGNNTNNVIEYDGPDVELFFNPSNPDNLVNESAFVSGEKINEVPLFAAKVFDVNGINTVGSGIGHDVMIIIDKDPSQSYILNDYFQSISNSYSDGIIKYKLPEMKNGKHTLTFRVWDLINNSTTKTIEFEVVKGLTPVIFSVSNYPNPVKSQTRIIVKHDRPESVLNTTVDIFDLAGRKIWSFSQSSVDDINWDLTSNNGVKVKGGIYLYRVNIKTANSDIYSKTNKMLILEQ
jgi:hypothetical protein